MKLPEPSTYTVDDLAARWGKSSHYVKDLIRRGELKAKETIQLLVNPKRLVMHTHILLSEVEAFEKRYADGAERPPSPLSIKEYAAKYSFSMKTVRRYIDQQKVRAQRGPGGRWVILD